MPNNESSAIVQRIWNYCHVLRDDGVSYGDYLEQLTYLLFLKMDEERQMVGQPTRIPEAYSWKELNKRNGAELEKHYLKTLQTLGQGRGLIPTIFHKAQNRIQDPAKLRRLVTLIDGEVWLGLPLDVKAEIYKGLVERNAQDTKSGARQYFTPRPLIQTMVAWMQPQPGQTICDPAAGTGGFLIAAHKHVLHHHQLDADQITHLNHDTLHGWEIVDNTARLCVMNLYLNGIGRHSKESPIHVDDALAHPPSDRFDMVLANPPFGKRSSVTFINEKGEKKTEAQTIERQDFWTSTSNKQLNFLQHIRTILKNTGRAAVVLPDNVLFEAGSGETVRRKMLHETNLHTILRLPTGIFYKPDVKANVLFFENLPSRPEPWTKEVWYYDLRTNKHFTLKQNPMQLEDLQDFIDCYRPGEPLAKRQETGSEENEDGRWRKFTYEELMARDKVNLDIFWLRDESLEDWADLREPDEIVEDMIEDLEAALEQLQMMKTDLGGRGNGRWLLSRCAGIFV